MWKPIVVVLVLTLPLAGFVNYRRNAHLDQELASRTYATVSDADLEALIGAYQAEIDRMKGRLGAQPQGNDGIERTPPSDYSGRVKGFEDFQASNRQWTRLRGVLLEHEAALAQLERERSIRDRKLDDPLRRIVRRVITF